ncbi:EAL domain-containing protein [Photobacterium nomapromontoriensis]|uniref:EAL domain-containing protein n=1 Tax=Photobacterium nomapromontoriensis TaxID=2910237 RepID=UPI003D0ACDDD
MIKKQNYFIFLVAFLWGCVTFLYYIEHYAETKSETLSHCIMASFEKNIATIDGKLTSVNKLYPNCSIESRKALEDLTFDTSIMQEISLIKDNKFICSDRIFDINTINYNQHYLHEFNSNDQYILYRGISQRRGVNAVFFMIQFDSSWYRVLLDPRYIDFWIKDLANQRNIYAGIYNTHDELLSESNNISDLAVQFKSKSHSPTYPYYVTTGYTKSMLVELMIDLLPYGLLIIFFVSLLVTFAMHHFMTWRESQFAEIQRGIEKKEFHGFYQPIVDSTTGAWIGAELLVRWLHPKRKVIYPNEFIPATEQSGQINEISLQLIEHAAFQKMEIMALNKPFYITINVTASMIANPLFVDAVIKLTEQYPVLTHGTVLEFSERDNFSNTNLKLLHSGMQKLRDIGIQWALDDFGTGYAGFSTLQALSFDIIKIDRSFVASSVTDSVTQSILGNMAEMGHKLNCKLVAEGVETQAQVDQIKALNIECCQGYFYAKPMPYSRFVAKFKIHSL